MKKRPRSTGSKVPRSNKVARSSGRKLQDEQMLRLEAETLNAVALDLAAELDLQSLMQKITDAGTHLSAAQFGSFFYNDVDEQGESYLLFTVSGAPREAFEKFGMPRKTALFDPTFRGEGIIRIDDVSRDPRYGQNAPHHGLPQGHLPVRSYLAVPVKSRGGEVLGALFFGHAEPGIFTGHIERLIRGIAAQAAIAIDNARLYTKAKQEIAKRLQAEQALRATEQRLETVFGGINDHLVSYDLQWRYTYVNDKAAAVLGRSKQELIGKCIWDLFPEAVGNQYHNELLRALSEQRVIRSEHYYASSDSWFENHIYPFPEGVTVFSADITWRKNAEYALRESEQRFARFMQNLPGLAWIKDHQGRYVYINDAAAEAFQRSFEQLYGKTDEEVFPPEIAAQFRQNDHRALASGSGIETVETLRHRDGVLHHSIVSKFPIFDKTGGAPLVGGIAIDITERKQAEQALQEADRRKDRFLATLAHELRNPLAPIRNSLHLLRMPIDSDAAGRVYEMMERQVNHMVRLVDDLMEVSRITRGQIELRKAELDLAIVIQNAVETSRPLIEAAGHSLEISQPPEPVPMYADAVRLAQVFSNLLNNAAKYTEHGGNIRLSVSLESDTVIVAVRDNGIGISEEILPHIFDMFSRAHHNAQGGLGVGLTLARSMVQMHGGSIEAHSEGPKLGSEFIVRLPLAMEAHPAATGNGENKSLPGAGAQTPRSILVVDDNQDAADSLCLLLRFLGNQVQVVHDGPSALAAIEKHCPAVVLLDLGMPGMDGYDVARHIRRQTRFAGISLVAVTGWGQEEDRKRTQSEGFDQHLVKPIDLNALQTLLAKL
jgi:PAS domain S-box-containing protein